MTSELVQREDVQKLLDQSAGIDQSDGSDRTKKITRKILSDIFETIDEYDISESEFWTALHFLQQAAPEFGLIAPGLGLERYLDIRADEKDRRAGLLGGTPRTIEGPLYVAGAPKSNGEARLDDGSEEGETLIMSGQVCDVSGKPLPGALVEVWHANTLGGYSYFDKSQSDFNLRRAIVTDDEGRYKFRSIIPSGYAVPPDGSTEQILQAVGRHGHRPAHIHFFVSKDGYRHLTTQINIQGDPYLYDDFAFATRDELIPDVNRCEDAAAIEANKLDGPFSEIEFGFELQPSARISDTEASARPRAGQD